MRKPLDVVIVVVLAFAVSLLAARHQSPSPFDGYLIDTDGYMRMARIEASLEAGRLLSAVPRDNGGEKIPLHWPHLLDVAIIVAALPMSLMVDWHRALHISGSLVGPASLASLAIASLFAARSLGGGQRFRLLPAILLLSAPSLIIYGYYGRPDHHVLLALVALVTAALAIFSSKEGAGSALAGWSGFAAAIGLWLSPEIIPFALLTWAFLLLVDARNDGRVGRLSVAFALAFTVSLAVATAIDPSPAGWFSKELDRLSIAYVLLGGLMSVAVIASSWGPVIVPPWRAAILAALPAILAVGAWVLIFPAVLGGAEGLQSSSAGSDVVGRIQEMRPVDNLKHFVSFLMVPSVVFAAGALIVLRRRLTPISAFCLTAAIVLLFFAFSHVRFSIYAQVAGAVVAAVLLERAMPQSGAARSGLRYAAVALAALILLAAPTVGAVILAGTSTQPPGRKCDPKAAVAELNGTAPGVLLAPIDQAPAILYFTRATVVVGPYHRAGSRVVNALNAFNERQFLGEIEPATVERTGADFILVCTHDLGLPDTLLGALARGERPGWVEEVPMPAASGYRLYRIRD